MLSNEFGIAMTEEEEREVETMCNLSQAVKEKKEKEVNVRVATDMLKDGKPITEIEKYSRLSKEVINAIALKLGIAIVLN